MNILHLYKADLVTATLCGLHVMQPRTYDLDRNYITCPDCTAEQARRDARLGLTDVGLDAALPPATDPYLDHIAED